MGNESSSSGGGGGGGGGFAHDVTSQSGLTSIYNERVVQADRMARPISSSAGAATGIPHEGVRVKTDHGNQYLIHKGDGFGASSQTVVVDANHMSSNWKTIESKTMSGDSSVGNYVNKGGANYSLPFDNCIHAADRMMKDK